MNNVEMHHKVAFFLDAENSPRFKANQIDKALRSAIVDIVMDRYHNIREREKKYAFQTAQRLRDELGTIVKRSANTPVSGDNVIVSGITDYWVSLSMKANISGDSVNTIPLTYDELNIVEQDPFRRPSITEPKRIYRIESSEGLQVIYGDIGALISGDVYYVAEPIRVDIGDQISTVGTSLISGLSVIAYVDSVITLSTGSTKTIKEGELYVIGSLSEVSAELTSGILFKNTISTDLPVLVHEEVCRKASTILLGNVENYGKKKSIDHDIQNPQ